MRAVVASAAEGYLYPPHWLHLAAGVSAALKGAGYAKLADQAAQHGGAGSGERAKADAYARTRSAYLAVHTRPAPHPITGGERATAVASIPE